MNIKYFHISTIQKDTKELGLLIEELKISSLTNAEIKAIKNLIIDFMTTLKSDLHVISESGYVDRTYRDSYYDYYSTKRSDFYRNCIRLSFFDSEFDSNVDLNNIDNIKNNYLGFLILRPLKACIGRNVISPKAKISIYSDIRICSVEVDSSCLGIKLKAKGFPHASQDSETMTCAQTTIWSILEYYGNKYTLYKPTIPTEIEQVLEPFSYERQLPSKGLTYNQISVALRKLGFAPKIYFNGKTVEQQERFRMLLACYIESGIPLAIALTGLSIGHATVCVGTENFNRNEVYKYPVTFETTDDCGNKIVKTLFSWNKAVAQQKFVFNDDNFPNYQVTTLDNPNEPYIQRGHAQWKGVSISQFIAPLYSKIYMDADEAIELSLQIIGKIIPDCEKNVMRTFLTSSRTFRNHIANSRIISNEKRLALLQICMPKFVWVTELSTPDEFNNKQISTLLILDATGSKMANLSRNIIFLISKSYYYRYDDISHNIKGSLTSFPEAFEMFPGNLE